ncbi:MAG: menaquinone biosynthesis decarboxylase [Prevotellaceae bacterium]|jgi:4-hydroxy-3-polyprenylbenzoate decarboxylase|nr:menaquinone biosynthesis decarboxylase [Prevotellaceae bacterium]
MILSDFVKLLESKNELIRVRQFVDTVFEIAEITNRFSKTENGGKALFFENTGTNFPILTNAFGSNTRICYALGVNNLDEISAEINKLFSAFTSPKTSFFDKLSLLPKLKQIAEWMPKHKSGKGKCQDVIMQNPDLNQLPVLKCYPFDGGKFITLPMVHTINPENNIRNVGMYRMQIFDEKTTGMHWHKHKTGAAHFEMYKNQNRIMPVVVTLGGDTVYTYAATAPLPDGIDEYIFAGFLRKKSVELVKCLTQPIYVPTDVDFVIEGYVNPQEPLCLEGAFGDHTGFYSLQDLFPKFHVTCITHKKNAIYPATLVGIPPQEDAYIAKATERIFLEPVRLVISPEVEDLNMPVEGVFHNIAIVKINKKYAGQAIKTANSLWGAGQMMFNKIMIIVNGNVDIHNYADLIEKINKNINIDSDIYFTKGPLDILDHSAQSLGFGGKICIDATEKAAEEKISQNNYENKKLYSFVNKNKFDKNNIDAKITIVFDDFVDVKNISQAVWLLGNNIDAVRDCKIIDGNLIVDACMKHKNHKSIFAESEFNFTRRCPNIACSSDETIKIIDSKWKNLNIGKFIPSPSENIKNLVLSEGAEFINEKNME